MTAPRIYSLYSGSTGNAFVIAADTGNLLIDAGKSARQLCRSLESVGIDPASLGAILLTHEHNDHISALSVFLKKYPIPVHLPLGCVDKLAADPAIAPLLVPHPASFEGEICGMHVTAFPTPHDSRASVGYRIEIPCHPYPCLLGYATDVGYVSTEVEQALCGCDAVVLESNHDPEMLRCGPYPYDLKMRIASRRGHLSNPDSAAFAAKLCANGTRALMLAHLSQENNTPNVALNECLGAVGDENVRVCVAQPDAVTELILEV